MADKKPAAAAPADAKPKLPLVPIIGAAVVSAVLVGGILFFVMSKPDAEAAAAGDEAGESAAAADASAEILYVEIKGPLVVNLAGGSARFLQVEVQLATRSASGAEAIEAHMPAIRSALLILLRQTTADDLAKPDAMVVLQTRVLDEANRVLQAQTGAKGPVDQVLFTKFVTQ